MKVDKFGLASLVGGIALVLIVLHFGFMSGPAGWSTAGLVAAIVTTILGGLILAGILFFFIGLFLLFL
ncbi:hypothetical protein HYS54_01315 [Candidatus Micrarchaeota archaeon]|nr:hypothetical protein [Candidatus Micrarchaeota archaeon]